MNSLEFTQDYFLYSPKKQGMYPVQESDWNRLKGLINSIIPEKKIYNILCSLAFGIFISSIFSVISLLTISNLPNWIMPTNIAVLVASFVIGIALLIIDSQQKEIIKISSKYILDEMGTIEEQFDKIESESTQ